MNSPFPGMDPYLEQLWSSVHIRLIVDLCNQLNAALPADLIATPEERIYVEAPPDDPRFYKPDIFVAEQPAEPARQAARGGVTATEHLLIPLETSPVKERFIQIVEAGTGARVITSIEVVSPPNKRPGKGRKLYLRKQRELRRGRVSSVEIDLIRSGPRVLPVPAQRLPLSRRTPCLACVRRGWKPLRAEVYPISLRERLPILSIPLRQEEPDEVLVLQSALDDVYREGRYAARIDYRRPPAPMLDPVDEDWADSLLKAAGRR